MLNTLIIILLILWVLGYFGQGRGGIPEIGNAVHILLVVVIVLFLLGRL